MIRRTALGVLLAAASFAPGRAEDAAPQLVPARIEKDVTLTGRWRMDRDVEVVSGVTLRLAAGTSIEVAPADGGKTGNFTELVEMHVHGRLVTEGTRSAPVVLAPAAGPAGTEADWQGIVFHADRLRAPDSLLRGVKIARAREAVVVTDGAPRIEESVFHSCRCAVLAARVLDEAMAETERMQRPQPEIVNSLFVACSSAVYAEWDGAPEVVRSSFLDCEIAIGNTRPKTKSWAVKGLGARADRCLFLRNRVAIQGCGIVENSILVRNDAALELSRFHAVHSSQIDRFAWRRNVLWDNAINCNGEADIGADNANVDPSLASEPQTPSFADAFAPLDGIALGGKSPSRGTALDGGDPGPLGAGPSAARGRAWRSASRALRTVLVLGPPDRVDQKNLPKTAPAAPGERAGSAWWAAFQLEDDGVFRRASLRAPPSVESIVLAFPWQASAAGDPSRLEINADGYVVAWRAGAPLAFPPSTLQRHGAAGVTAPLATGAPSGVVVWWKSSDLDPRMGVALDRGSSPPPDASPAPPLEAGPVRFGARQAGLRLARPFHWADIGREGVFRVRTADGRLFDGTELGLTLYDASGTLRVDLPAGVDKKNARFVVDGLRDPAGRVFAGQPFECAAWLPE